MSNYSLYHAALDQYLAIVFALRYENLITELRIWLLILFTWLLSIVIGALASFVYHVNSNNLWSCNVISTKENDYQIQTISTTYNMSQTTINHLSFEEDIDTCGSLGPFRVNHPNQL